MLEQLELKLNVRQRLESCTLAEKQQVLLARALSHQCRFLILDEPTAPLDQEESARLFRVVRRLQSEGIGIVFISHRIHELREVCDQLTVLRDGRRVSHDTMEGMSGEQIVEKCSAIHWRIFSPRRAAVSSKTRLSQTLLSKTLLPKTLLSVSGLHDQYKLRDISLTLHQGEILGIAGLAGAGKTELCKALFGDTPVRWSAVN